MTRSFEYHVSHPGIDDNREALELILAMLRMENEFRLSREYIDEYAQVSRLSLDRCCVCVAPTVGPRRISRTNTSAT